MARHALALCNAGSAATYLVMRDRGDLAEYDAIIPKRLREANLDVDPKPKLAWVRDVSKKV